MRKNQMLMAAAVAALVAGSGLAMGQGAPGAGSAPAEKSAPAASEKGGGALQMNEKKGLNAPAKGVERRGSETTGQAPAQSGGSIQLGDDQKGQKDLRGQKDQKGPKASQSNDKMNKNNQSQAPRGRNETTGQAPAQPGGSIQLGDDQKGQKDLKGPKAGQANDKMNKNSQRGRNETTGQAPRGSGSPGSAQQNQPGSQQNQIGQGREPSGQTPMRGESKQDRSGTSSSTTSTTNVNVNLNAEQKTRIHEVIVKERSAPRVASVNFSLNVGTTVPKSVKRARLPSTIVEIQPAWRGYEYFLVGDQIVIVDPRTLHIVAIIEV